MANRFYTILIIPEKTSRVRKIVLPGWILKGTAIGLSFVILIGTIMVFDYWYVMNQIGENKQLKMENRRLRQQVQVFKNKITTIESTMERVKTFATRLKVITNIEDRSGLLQTMNNNLPDAATNIGGPAAGATPAAMEAALAEVGDSRDPEAVQLRKEYDQLDNVFTDLNRETLYVEQLLQDQYELLADQKAFLAALPMRKPAVGYFTSGFGVRRSPYGGRVKMHEGLDIANRPGTSVKAPADGIIAFADSKAGYGQTIIINHGYGVETWYGHNKKILVTKGQKVRRGDSIALLGSSGRSTGPHVHYEVRVNGTPVDPLSYLLEN
ncbi:MAG TPA: M23 family metallopeptidase [Bdellovibrionota bacterium]|nr:M23 family metallopeptidase [Bdellovibrionota bacterium]